MNWQLLNSGLASAEVNMALDYELLNRLSSTSNSTLHFYEWKGDCATYGYFVDPSEYLDIQRVKKCGLDLARRPTGGGIIFHLCDLAFSVLIPASHPAFSINTMDNYAFVNSAVAEAVSRFSGRHGSPELLPCEPAPLDEAAKNFCMSKPTRYDVMLDGRKVGGGAQRRTRHGFLHQGTIALAMPSEEYLNRVLKPGTQVVEGMRRHGYSLLGSGYSRAELESARKSLRGYLQEAFWKS